jgi:hypothetical protein
MKFKGFGQYIEIFKGGKQTDSSGTEHDGDSLIDKALSLFNASEHEPPAVIGHPEENAPAFAWVEDLKEEIVDGDGQKRDVQKTFSRFLSGWRIAACGFFRCSTTSSQRTI